MAAFGSVFMPKMALATFENNQWSDASIVASDSIQLHPGAHVLHYSSTCFEGLKAFRHADGSVHVFRMDQNIKRLAQSSRLLSLPTIDEAQVSKMIVDAVAEFATDVPEPPGSMYIRPTHIGTEAAVGKAAAPTATSMLYVLLSPVGDYFTGGAKALRLLLDETGMRCAPHMGMIKSGGNYASALGPISRAKAEVQADQILFCPNGDVQETGAANFLLIDGNEIITKGLDSSFLHGVTRSSILTLAADLGMTVTERDLTVAELLERAAKPEVEAVLSGTAAVLTSVGTFIHNDKEYKVGTGEPGPIALKLRQALNDIQWGKAEDKHNWLTKVC
ncbi:MULTISPECIES: branched-chain amino acid aminotransferase [Marinomonas]|uniref:Branched-chain-amino-acid aminotransferase n=1 Tax=Marinomonas polaris DSM 16579 TaxID=1122206 RepID=A0A1M4T678_9GAMM|nr:MULTISPECIES: branched-chain amino acid aminotransferase [Marinomonas]PJE54972.1 branched-chain amino acid aminotransferase [Marinomonas sp. BSi20584]SHE39910.1 branched-chain amino acid aminotransferase [Marinomonas polaris DSM 16579]